MSDWNRSIIEEFRNNKGKVGGPFEGAPLLLLHTRGAKTGEPRLNPLMYQAVGEDFAIFASKGGSPANPDWYHNLLTHPRVTIDVGTVTIEVNAREAKGDERERIWSIQKQRYPQFETYEQNTSREIPVIVLNRTT